MKHSDNLSDDYDTPPAFPLPPRRQLREAAGYLLKTIGENGDPTGEESHALDSGCTLLVAVSIADIADNIEVIAALMANGMPAEWSVDV